MKRYLKKLFIGKKFAQPVFKRLFLLSLEGMNIGTGGGKIDDSGERFAIGYALKGIERPVIFDVGAQGGEYLSEALNVTNGKAQIHAFEPNSKDYAVLKKEFGDRIELVNSALGDTNGEATLYFPNDISGLSSLYGGNERFTKLEKVKIETIDSYCKRKQIRKIDLLKLDVEGHELQCLKGAKEMLSSIKSIQFEIGLASREARVYFRDIFELLSDYKISRILRDGFEEIKNPDKLAEVLYTTNYLAERK